MKLKAEMVDKAVAALEAGVALLPLRDGMDESVYGVYSSTWVSHFRFAEAVW